jgi:hypothetical protein
VANIRTKKKLKWLKWCSSVLIIHFLPPDTVFGNSEQELGREEAVVDGKKYANVIVNHTTLALLESDCRIFE